MSIFVDINNIDSSVQDDLLAMSPDQQVDLVLACINKLSLASASPDRPSLVFARSDCRRILRLEPPEICGEKRCNKPQDATLARMGTARSRALN